MINIVGVFLVLLPVSIYTFVFVRDGHYLTSPVLAEHPLSLSSEGTPAEISIDTATYGGNCGATQSNATNDVVLSCNGKMDCAYKVEVGRLGDPASGCSKDFSLSYACLPDSTLLYKKLPPEAGLGSILKLTCPIPRSELAKAETPPPDEMAKSEPTPSGVVIRSATYGGNCGAAKGNATSDVASSCNGKMDCSYSVDVGHLGDPASKCGKDFVASYSCAPDTTILRKALPAEAGFGSILKLSCAKLRPELAKTETLPPHEIAKPEPTPTSGVVIRSATYGGNCGAAKGNATSDVVSSCNGKMDCSYSVDVGHLGDPVSKCGKDFVASYSCAPDTTILRKALPAEAGFGSILKLSCAKLRPELAKTETLPPHEIAKPEPTPTSGVVIRSATYGGNCGAAKGNATSDVVSSCNGKMDCSYSVDVGHLGDPASKCGKDFVASYSCAPDTTILRKALPAEAGFGSILKLSCAKLRPELAKTETLPPHEIAKPEPTPTSGVVIRSATYGGNCGAAKGNATSDVVSSCNGKMDCSYSVDVGHLGDPVSKCGKDFVASYSCAPDTTILRKALPAEAGFGSILKLNCAKLRPELAKTETLPPHEIAKPEPTPTSGVVIRSATYGGNCGAAKGNATSDVVSSCNGKMDCSYSVEVGHLGDPASKCGKDFVASYSCAPDTTILRKALPAEAGFGSILKLSCAQKLPEPTQ